MTALRLFALDMDGTLLDKRKRITPRVRAALKSLDDRGVCVTAATGRGWAEMHEIRSALPFMRWGILTSGAMICDLRTGDVLSLTPMDTGDVLRCVEMCGRQGAMPHFLTVKESVVRSDQVGRLGDFHHGDHQEAFERICLRTGDMAAYARAHPGEILKVCMYHRTPGDRQRSLEGLRETGLDLRFSGYSSLEAVAPGVNKGAGLRALADRLGIPVGACAAVGDGENDLEMLAAAGRSAAMGNAPESVRRAADIVVADNDSDGAAEAAERLFGGL